MPAALGRERTHKAEFGLAVGQSDGRRIDLGGFDLMKGAGAGRVQFLRSARRGSSPVPTDVTGLGRDHLVVEMHRNALFCDAFEKTESNDVTGSLAPIASVCVHSDGVRPNTGSII
jgi:hypothetical protein